MPILLLFVPSLCAVQELANQGQGVDCFCHISLLAQPCFQPCSPQKPMAERQLPPEGIKRSVCAAFPSQALRIHLVTWKSPFHLAPSSAPPSRLPLSGETALSESLEPADSALGGGDWCPFLSSDYRGVWTISRRWLNQEWPVPPEVHFLVPCAWQGINSQDFITSSFTEGRRAGTGTVDQAVPGVSCLSLAWSLTLADISFPLVLLTKLFLTKHPGWHWTITAWWSSEGKTNIYASIAIHLMDR